jgi:hypothetical protein
MRCVVFAVLAVVSLSQKGSFMQRGLYGGGADTNTMNAPKI